jgi:S-adenosylmethionine:tRNA ribosyltransferase-isomerase
LPTVYCQLPTCIMHPKNINIKDYSYELPESSIAKFPMEERDRSKLLVYKDGQISESVFVDLDKVLPEDSLIVFNNTRVIHARMLFQRATGAQIEIFCIEPADHHDYQLSFSSKGSTTWKCMVGNAKRWKDDVLEKHIAEGNIVLKAERLKKEDELFHIRFSWEPAQLSFAEVLHKAGNLPIPPYLNRDTETLDETRYQTIYAQHDGSVAAPTAGLHFTEQVFEKLDQKNIRRTEVTLHVGAGTFRPVKAEQLAGHEMHEETVFITHSTLQNILACMEGGKSLVAVGTTSTRTLESLYWYGVKLMNGIEGDELSVSQWDPYENYPKQPSAIEVMRFLISRMATRQLTSLHGTTQIIIAPGYEFKVVDILITNFHQPENTLMLLVAAFTGPQWKNIYSYALEHDFRFLSYGDSSVLFKNFLNTENQ